LKGDGTGTYFNAIISLVKQVATPETVEDRVDGVIDNVMGSDWRESTSLSSINTSLKPHGIFFLKEFFGVRQPTTREPNNE